MNEEVTNYDALTQRLNASKTAPGSPWMHFWDAYDKTCIFYEIEITRQEIEGL